MLRKKRVLLVSRDLTLLQTRKLMLGAYFDVNAVGRVIEARKILEEKSFDLIVFCYTLTEDDCRGIMDKAMEHCPQTKMLILTITEPDVHRAKFPAQLRTEGGPFMLIKHSAEVLGLAFGANGRMLLESRPSARARWPQ
jgi:hypothetical protein